jgi:hypothetical protein
MLLNSQVASEAQRRKDEEVIIERESTESLPATEQAQEQEETWYNRANVPRDLSR